jgi:hypothetical protein
MMLNTNSQQMPTPAAPEIIIKHLLTLEKGEFIKKGFFDAPEGYRSRVDMYFLKAAFMDKTNIERIAAFCSDSIIFKLIEGIKKLRFDFPNGINIKIKTLSTEYDIKTEFSNSNLFINIKNDSKVISQSTILNFENFDKLEIKQKYLQILDNNNITYLENDSNNSSFEILIDALFNGSYFSISDTTISRLDYGFDNRESPIGVFSLFFRDLLNELAKTNFNLVNIVLREISSNQKFRLPFFQRIIIFVIGENWNLLRNIFLENITESDPRRLFSDIRYQDDLYELLNKNQEFLNEDELEAIQRILDNGPQEIRENLDVNPDFWRFRWFSALRNLPKYSELYSSLSKQFGEIDYVGDNENEVLFKDGDSSPMTTEKILELSNVNIVKYIHSFKPKHSWEEPTISGFSSMLGKPNDAQTLKFS